jgi:hypothetical protein
MFPGLHDTFQQCCRGRPNRSPLFRKARNGPLQILMLFRSVFGERTVFPGDITPNMSCDSMSLTDNLDAGF